MNGKNNHREWAKWLIGVITSCVLIYLGIRHINHLAEAVVWLAKLIAPLLCGLILALIFNVPMSFCERFLRDKLNLRRGVRPLAILFSLVLVAAIFVGVAFLVLPELYEAVKLIVGIIRNGLDLLSEVEDSALLTETTLGQYLSGLSIDWPALRGQLESWFDGIGTQALNYGLRLAGNMASNLVTFFLGLVFAIYILANKETLKRQVCRLIHAWLPAGFGNGLIHVARVCSNTFRQFIAGQATEAIILGVLCMLGMLILRIPYAPMIGALVGVTALVPIVGAFVGLIVGAIMIVTVAPFKAVIFVIFLLVLQQIEGNLIYPRVVGTKIKLPAIWVLAAVTVGGNLAGPIGMLLGVPTASAAYTLIKEATRWREQKIQRLND